MGVFTMMGPTRSSEMIREFEEKEWTFYNEDLMHSLSEVLSRFLDIKLDKDDGYNYYVVAKDNEAKALIRIVKNRGVWEGIEDFKVLDWAEDRYDINQCFRWAYRADSGWTDVFERKIWMGITTIDMNYPGLVPEHYKVKDIPVYSYPGDLVVETSLNIEVNLIVKGGLYASFNPLLYYYGRVMLKLWTLKQLTA